MLISGFSTSTPSHSSQWESGSFNASSRYSRSLMRLTMAMMSASVWKTGVDAGNGTQPVIGYRLSVCARPCRTRSNFPNFPNFPGASFPTSDLRLPTHLAVSASSPHEHPLERVEEGSRILELGQEALPIPLQETRPELGRET